MNKKRSGAIVALIPALIAFSWTASAFADSAPQFNANGFEKGQSGDRLSADLRRLESEYAAYLATPARARQVFSPTSPVARISAGYIVVDALPSNDPDALKSDLLGIGAIDIEVHKNVVSARLPIGAIGALKKMASLRFVKPFYATTHVGDTTSQGDVAQRSDQLRTSSGADGNGVRVGVLSDSYDCLSGAADDVASGDLPAAGVTVLLDEPGCGSGTDEGRAMLQIVHDVAPGASLSFNTAFTGQAGFANGITALADDIVNNNAGVGVIVDDVLYFAEPMFQDGIIGQAADAAVAAGIPYYSSAGNAAQDSYESPYVESGLPGLNGGILHDFDPGPGVAILQELFIPVGGSLTASFQWNQPFFSVSGAPGAATDLDVFLIGADGITVLAAGNDFNIGADPVEVFSFSNSGFNLDGVPGLDTRFFVLIENFSGPNPSLLKYSMSGAVSIQTFDTDSATAYGHPNARHAQAVAAAGYFDTPEFGVSPPQTEGFSSRGGIPVYWETDGTAIDPPEYRPKPEITAPDGGNTTFFGGDFEPDGFPNFFGTSAAAPHAAGVAALLLSIDTNRTPDEVNGGLRDSTVDILPAGFDVDSGSGLIDAWQANNQLSNGAPDLDPIPSQRGATGDTLTFVLDTTTNPDPEADAVTFAADNLPSFCSAPTNNGDGTGSIACSIAANDTGRFAVVARAIDDSANARTDIEGFYVIANENTGPTLASISGQTIDENQQAVFSISSTDAENQDLTLAVNFLPGFCNPVVDNGDGSGSLTCNPGFNDAGGYSLWVVSTDDGVPNMADTQLVTLQVDDLNRAPVLASIGDRTMNEGQLLTIALSATDPDTDNSPTYQLAGLPGFCALTDDLDYTGEINCAPLGMDAGPYDITVTINDNAAANLSDDETFRLTVNDINLPPVLEPIGDQATSIGQLLDIAITATDSDGDALTIGFFGTPSFCTPTDNGDGTGMLSCAPTLVGEIATYPIRIEVLDNGVPAQMAEETFDLVIRDVNQPPQVASINTLPVVAGVTSAIAVSASDPDANNLTLSATLPGYCGLTDNGDGSGLISCLPSISDSGSFAATLFADDDGVPPLQGFANFDVQVTDRLNAAPVLEPIGNQPVLGGETLQIGLTATDDAANTLTFSATGIPGFCNPLGDAGNGTALITCNPQSSDTGNYPVTVTVRDDGTPWVPGSNTPPLADSETFSIVVGGEQTLRLTATGVDIFEDFSVVFRDDGDGLLQFDEIISFSGVVGFPEPPLPEDALDVYEYFDIAFVPAIAGISTESGTINPSIPCSQCWEFAPGLEFEPGTPADVSDGWFSTRWTYEVTPYALVDDQNLDQKSDILLRNSATGANFLYLMDGPTITQGLPISTVSPDWSIIGRGDFNGDGVADILWRFGPTGAIWIFEMNGNSVAASLFVATVADPDWLVVANGDYNGDGKDDILFHHQTNGTVWLYQMDGNTITNSAGVGVVPDTNWKIFGSGDYNGDGKSDIVWRNIATGTNWMYLMDGATIATSTGVSVTPDLHWNIVGSGDYNADGKSDILWRNGASGTNWVFLMDGTSIATSTSISVVPDPNWIIVGDGDYNGDGYADILWRNLATGSNVMYLMQGTSILQNSNVSTVTDQNWQIVDTD